MLELFIGLGEVECSVEDCKGQPSHILDFFMPEPTRCTHAIHQEKWMCDGHANEFLSISETCVKDIIYLS